MNSVKIGFLAHGPASANSLKPIIDILNLNSSNKVLLYAYHDYVSELWRTVKLEHLNGYPDDMKELDILIYGTGSTNDIEINVPKFCLEHNIISVSILDLFWSNEEDLKGRFPVLPDYFLVPNEETLEETRRILGSESNYIATGNPHFDRLQNHAFSRSLKPPFNVAFFSQCTATDDYSDMHGDSYSALMELIRYRDLYPALVHSIKVKPHPREDKDTVVKLCEEHSLEFTEEDSTLMLSTADFIYGYKCTLQYEALLIGKPVSFYGQEDLASSVDKYIKTQSEPVLQTVNAAIRCTAIVSDLIDEIISKRKERVL